MVVAQDMWWWWPRICGGGGAGYVVGEIKNKANSAQLELELGLSLAKSCSKCQELSFWRKSHVLHAGMDPKTEKSVCFFVLI